MFKPRRVITGCTEQLALADIVQTLTLGTKTACVTLSRGRRQGKIWFENGVAKHARTDRSTGEEAFYELVTWTSAKFVIEHGVESSETSLDVDGMLLVMEGLRRLDESSEQSPGPEETEGITSAATGPGRDASPNRETLRSSIWTRTAVLFALLFGATVLILVARNLTAGVPPPEAPVLTSVVAPLARDAPARTLAIPSGIAIGSDTVADTAEPSDEDAAVAEQPPATPEPEPEAIVEARAEPPADAPGVSLEELAQIVDVMPLGMIGPIGELLPEHTPPPASYVDLEGRSLVEAGTLTLFVDGEEIFSRELASDSGQTKGFFKKLAGRATEQFDAQLEIPAGEHELVARVDLVGSAIGHEETIVLDLEPGATQTVKIVAGRKKRPLSLKALDLRGAQPVTGAATVDSSPLDD